MCEHPYRGGKERRRKGTTETKASTLMMGCTQQRQKGGREGGKEKREGGREGDGTKMCIVKRTRKASYTQHEYGRHPL